jgi:hypothetical protein
MSKKSAGAGVVDIEKALQIAEGVGLAQGLHARVGQRHAVALRQREDQLRLQRAFDVDVQLGLGHAAQQRRPLIASNRIEGDRWGSNGHVGILVHAAEPG